MKKSFILYHDIIHVFKKLSNEQAGMLIKAILEYEVNGELPKLDFALDLAVTPILQSLDRNRTKHEEVSRRRAEAGSKGGKQKVANLANASNCYENDSDIENDSDNEINISCAAAPHEEEVDQKKYTKKEHHQQSVEIMQWLIEKSGKNFRIVETHLKQIRALLNDGIKKWHICFVITCMCEKWKNTEREVYLRPKTLFLKSNFENYYGEFIKKVENEDVKDEHVSEVR